MFVGRLADGISFDSTSGVASMPLVGLAEAKLEAANAQKVSTELLNQVTSPAQGNGTILTFSTVTPSLWRSKNIRVNSVVQAQGSVVTTEDLNDAEVNASLVFVAGSAPGNLLTLLWDGDQWYRDKSISELVGLLCDAAGITAGNRLIEEPIYTGIDQSVIIDSAADLALATLTDAEVTSLSGWLRRRWFLFDKFDDGNITADPAWTSYATPPTVSGGKMVIGGNSQNGPIVRSIVHDKAGGTFDMKITRIAAAPYFMMVFPFGYRYGTEYGFYINQDGGADPNQIGFVDSNRTGLGTGSGTLTAGVEHAIRMTLNPTTNAAILYLDGAQIATHTFPSGYVPDSFSVWNSNPGAGTGDCIKLDDIYFSNAVLAPADAVETANMKWKSNEKDLLAAPASWLPMEIARELNGGTITISTDVSSSSGGAYDGELPVDGTNTPTSALKRYAKLVIESTISGSAGVLTGPEIDKIILNWRGTSLFIKSADFTGMTVIEAIDELARMGGMDYGTKGDGVFYFRNRTVSGTSDLGISQKNAIVAIQAYNSGYKAVRPIAQVRYGKSGSDGYYFAEYKASDAGEASPTTAQRFGVGETAPTVTADLTKFLFSNNASVAVAIARKLYTENYRPKRTFRVRCRIIPHLDTGDKVSISFHDSPLIEKAIFGDPLQRFPVTGPNARTIARDILMKVVGTQHDINKSESVLDLEEVLS